MCTIILGVVNFMSVFVASMLIDRLGRKILLYMSSVVMTLTLGSLGTFFYVREVMLVDTTEFNWIPLACLVAYVVGFSIGFGPVPWLMMGEILPGKRQDGSAIELRHRARPPQSPPHCSLSANCLFSPQLRSGGRPRPWPPPSTGRVPSS